MQVENSGTTVMVVNKDKEVEEKFIANEFDGKDGVTHQWAVNPENDEQWMCTLCKSGSGGSLQKMQ